MLNEDNSGSIWELGSAFACPNCDLPLFYSEDQITSNFHNYFYGGIISCYACDKKHDWWSIVLHAIKGKSRYTESVMVIGARQTAFTIMLQPHQMLTIKFANYGIPEDARIFRVKYHVDSDKSGGLIPLEMYEETPFRYAIPAQITLYPAPIIEETPSDTQVIVEAIWMPRTEDEEAWRQIIASFDAYSRQSYTECIVPANVSVESTISIVINSFLRSINLSGDNVENFLNTGATYSHQLNIVLPALLSFTKAPKLPDHIRGLLNRLREYRNDIAHRGAVQKALSGNDAAETVCAALFGFHYLQLVRSILLHKKGK